MYFLKFWKIFVLKIYKTIPSTFLSNFSCEIYLSRIINYCGIIFALYLTWGAFSLVCFLSVFFFFLSSFFSFTIGIFLDRLERFIGWQGRVRESPANEHSVISSRFIPLLFTRSFCNYQTDSWWDLFSLKPALTFKNVFAKFNFSPAFFEKISSFICFVFKIGNKWILKLQNLHS